MLNEKDRNYLEFSMRWALLGVCENNVSLLESTDVGEVSNFIAIGATYEQLLNLAFNPERDTNYAETELLEAIAVREVAVQLFNMFEIQKEVTESKQINITSVKDKMQILESLILEKEGDDLGGKRPLTKTAKDKLFNFYIKYIQPMVKRMISSTEKMIKKHPQINKPATWVVSATAISLAVASSFIYKKIFAESVKLCKNKTGVEAKKCIATQRVNAEKAAIRALMTARANCSKNKKPDKCRTIANKEIKKRQKRIQKLNKQR